MLLKVNSQQIVWITLVWCAGTAATCLAQTTREPQPSIYENLNRRDRVSPGRESDLHPTLAQSNLSVSDRDPTTWNDDTFPTPTEPQPSPSTSGISAETLRKLMRPRIKLAGEWLSETNGIEMATFDTGITIPTYPIFGPPPPMLSGGFNFTTLDAPSAADLPDHLYESKLSLGWMRRFNDRWLARFMAGVSYATDGNNQSDDVWRFRGGAFAIYRRNPQWTWTLGAIALGRNDLPVVPAIGVVYQPHADVRFDLIMPKPRIAWLLKDLGQRQRWGYIGAGLNGATWGVERNDGVDDQLTYGDFRAVVGWESIPTPEPGLPFSQGRKIGFEVGYVFSRDFEWEYADRKHRLDDTVMLRGWMNF